MLSYHCPQCSMPLFKHEGRIICPSCKKEAEIVGEGKNAVVRLKEEEKKEEEDTEVEEVSEEIREEVAYDGDLEDVLKRIVLIVAKRLMKISSNEDVSSLKDYLEVLRNLIELIERVRLLNL